MILFPAIDLVAGKVVRLERGERSRMTVYAHDPAEVARSFAAAGARWIHVVDLSAAFGEDAAACAANMEAIERICAVDGISVDAGGGVRSVERIRALTDAGCSRVALGTALVRDPDFAREAAASFGGALAADIAARGGMVKVDGWREGAGLSAQSLAAQLAGWGFRHLVYTDIARDGMQTGIDAEAYRAMAQVTGFPVVASGGMSSLDDIRALQALGEGAVEGAIVGRALYEGSFTLEEALAAARGEGV